MKVGEGRACYTFGELLQGQIWGYPMLVSLPVESYAHAVFYPSSSAELLTPATKVKVRQAVNQLMRDYKMDSGGVFFIESPLPEGKGFATSTADMIAACRAVASVHNLRISPHYLSSLIAEIEPTDGTMYEEVVAYRHRQGRLLARLGHLPPMKVIGIDRGGHVDTLIYNDQMVAYTQAEEQVCSHLLKQLQKSIALGDCRGIGAVATQSAIMHEPRLSNPFLPALLELMEETGAAGVVTAHSGTVSGLLLDASSPFCETQASYIVKIMAEWGCQLYSFDTISRTERGVENDTAVSDGQPVYASHLARLVDYTR
ncbi:hypothetical protein PP175_22125 [Aneurinibacillus sp. Ricciae_BoGa-3]|uniref:GHMP family kinase ATP-binding protein n=1 Tax=Aneurinibacillus sp. Ricciae_BoGa-3 TaxID=3022697 RepID=UPI002341EE70|nr:hypothetical protein [Aneurinibacillus sp. Ricciae_BoGa-3]WCK53988.1 hypothetical protein PP175_22125 [Aneurinibacillus sp. Ricciae_BoGa-3]